MELAAGGYGNQCWREISYGLRVCKLIQLYWQISHLNLKGIKKKASRYVLFTHTHPLYFQTSQKFSKYKAFSII